MITVDGISYASHGEYFRANPKAGMQNKERNSKALIEASGERCKDCGLSWHPAAMTLDHIQRDGYRDHKNRRVYPSSMLSYPPELFDAEIAKCDPVCGNCHRIREMKRDGHLSNKKWLAWHDRRMRGAWLLPDEKLVDRIKTLR